jgi:hypothetical protein
MPSLRVDYIRVAGTRWIGTDDERYESSLDLRGPLILLVQRVRNTILEDMPRGFHLVSGQLQAETPTELPADALREALVNSFIHRTFRVNRPIQVIRYANRIEIINPGFSLKAPDSLGEPGSELRNPFISEIFHDTNLAETKGSGIGSIRNGSRSWFGIGSFGIQPSEFAKLGLIVFSAKYLANNEKLLKNIMKGVIPLLLVLFLIFGLIMLQPDFGTGMIIVVSVLAMMFIAGVNIKFFIGLGILGVFGIIGLIVIAPYRMDRITSFIDPWSDPLGTGFQIIQSLYSIGPGDVFYWR